MLSELSVVVSVLAIGDSVSVNYNSHNLPLCLVLPLYFKARGHLYIYCHISQLRECAVSRQKWPCEVLSQNLKFWRSEILSISKCHLHLSSDWINKTLANTRRIFRLQRTKNSTEKMRKHDQFGVSCHLYISFLCNIVIKVLRTLVRKQYKSFEGIQQYFKSTYLWLKNLLDLSETSR